MSSWQIQVITGDITRLAVSAIVNAANASLLGGGGVDGAIHRAGGPAILAACRRIRAERYPDGLPTGHAVITPGGNLPARFVIHTVGPIHHQETEPAALLAACYHNALLLAHEYGLDTIAFPGISTGIYGYPKEEAARVAIAAIHDFFRTSPPPPRDVILVAFAEDDAALLRQALQGA